MKAKISQLLGWLYLAGAAYYGSTSAYGLVREVVDARASTTLLAASIWVAIGGFGLIRRRPWGWWTLMAFFMASVGAHLNRAFATQAVPTNVAALEPFFWAAAHIAVLAWCGYATARGETPATPLHA